eukprot:1133211-Alexandrium_andersonii.AAC.1
MQRAAYEPIDLAAELPNLSALCLKHALQDLTVLSGLRRIAELRLNCGASAVSSEAGRARLQLG